MDVVKDAFENRVQEIDSYLRLLRKLDDNEVRLCFPSRKTAKAHRVQSDDIKLLKASAFLLIYNLVEASVRDGFGAIYASMKDESSSYREVTEAMQELWLQKAYRNITYQAPTKTYSDVAKSLIANALDGTALSMEKNDIRVSGNVDAQKIRELCQTHGVSFRAHPRAFGGAELKTVKDHRNDLAHGSMSFSECGRMYTIDDLERIKNQVVVYMRSILRNIDRFILTKQYAATAP